MSGPYLSVDMLEKLMVAGALHKLHKAIDEFRRMNYPGDVHLLMHPSLLSGVTRLLDVPVVHNPYAPKGEIYLLRTIDVYADVEDQPTKETP